MDAFVRRALLKPLARRQRSSADQAAMIAAFARLNERGLGEELVKQLRNVLKDAPAAKLRHDVDAARKQVALARALYLSRRISKQEYVVFASIPVEGVHEQKVFEGDIAKELEPINASMDALRQQHGLEEWQSWSGGEGPRSSGDWRNDFQRSSRELLSSLSESSDSMTWQT